MGPLLFSTRAYQVLCAEIAGLGAWPLGSCDQKLFPDGERYLRIRDSVAGRPVVVVGGTVSDADTLELYDLASGLVESGAESLTLLIPYFGHSTMERAVFPGEVVTAKTRARLLSSLPLPSGGTRVVLLDLHSEGIPFYFEGGVRPIHLYAKPVILKAIEALGTGNAVMACADAGRAKWVESLANDLGLTAAFVFKRRLDGEKTEVAASSARVEGKHVILYDDMIRTGGSLLGAAKAYRDSGAARVSAVTTHALPPEGAIERLLDSDVVDALVCTNSHPKALTLKHPKVRCVSVASVFAEFLSA